MKLIAVFPIGHLLGDLPQTQNFVAQIKQVAQNEGIKIERIMVGLQRNPVLIAIVEAPNQDAVDLFTQKLWQPPSGVWEFEFEVDAKGKLVKV